MDRPPKPALRPRLRPPQLGVAWESRRRAFASNLALLLARTLPLRPGQPRYFYDSWRGHAPRHRSVLASALLHVGILVFPFTNFASSASVEPRTRPDSPDLELTWYQPPRDLPPLAPPAPKPKSPAPRRAPEPPTAEPFNPLQTILTTPLRPNHPRQTLIQPQAPPEPPKILPQLPNIVQWVEPAVAPKPRLHISPESLAKLRPRTRARRPVADLPLPAVPNQQPIAGELNIALSQPVAPKPRLPVTPMSVPLAGPRRDAGDAGPAPEIGPITPNGLGSSEFRSIIALSPEPAPPAPVELPPGNLASRLSMGPNLLGSGTAGSGNGSSPGGDSAGSGSGGGAGPPGVFISKPAANETSPVAGPPGSGTSNPAALPEAPKPLPARPEPGVARSRPLIEYEPRKLGTYDPTSPELVLGPKRVYTLHINAPNLTSRTGSWVVRFAELDEEAHNPPGAMRPDLVGPAPLRKVDPKYPPALMEARVEGEVVLYAIIRRDGTVDSVQVIRSVDPQLDRNAAEAFVRWKFRPAERNGLPVDVEAVVAIPFRASAPF